MPDLQQYSVRRTVDESNTPTSATVNVKPFTISCLVLDEDGNTLADFTGDNALSFPSVLSTLTDQQTLSLIDDITNLAQKLVLMKAGQL